MITLPDFYKCVQLQRLKEKMGVQVIPVLPAVKFEREVTVRGVVEEPNPAIQIETKLEKGSIDVTYSDIIPDPKGLLTYKGRKVAAYIRDQRRGITPFRTQYRYHLYDCKALRQMRAAGRETRYFVTKRKDGYFDVHDLSGYRLRKRTMKLELCYFCVQELRFRRLYFDPFSLDKYFERNESAVPKTIKKTISDTTTQTYTPEQEDISREYKRAANHCCQSCGVNCSSNPSLLHLHHRDGNPSNNQHENLSVFCVDCHSRQPYHTQVSHTSRAREQIRDIKRLRAQQGIPDLD